MIYWEYLDTIWPDLGVRNRNLISCPETLPTPGRLTIKPKSQTRLKFKKISRLSNEFCFIGSSKPNEPRTIKLSYGMSKNCVESAILTILTNYRTDGNRTVDRRTFVPASIELMFDSNSPIVKQMWASAIVFLRIFNSSHCCCTYCTCTTYYKRKTKL